MKNRKNNYKRVRSLLVIIMMAFVFCLGKGQYCEAQTAGQILCTNNTEGYPGAKLLDITDTDYFNTDEYSNNYNYSQLKITAKNTMLVINGPITEGGTRNYVDGILLSPNVTLTIRLESSTNFYTYGRKGAIDDGDCWIYHAGIEVPYNSTLIIETTKEGFGSLIAVGAGSGKKGNEACGTGAGIGGRGYEFIKKRNSSRMYKGEVISGKYTYADCGTVIIRSGIVYACGGCGIGSDGNGTGAGIGGGGVYQKKIGGDKKFSEIYSGRGGTVKIYGGYVEAYGGGTLNNNGAQKNIYAAKKDMFFNNKKGFYISNGDVSDSDNKDSHGTGAGIGGGGLYVYDEINVHMLNEMTFEHWGGKVYAFGGEGARREVNGGPLGIGDVAVGSTRGGGCALGGGGGFSCDKDHYSKDKGVMFEEYNNLNVYTSGYIDKNISELSHTPGYNLSAGSYEKNDIYYPKVSSDMHDLGLHITYNTIGRGEFLGLGGWSYDSNTGLDEDGNSGTLPSGLSNRRIEPKGSNSKFPAFPREAYTYVAKPKVESIEYMVDEFKDEDVTAKLKESANYTNSVVSAIENAESRGVMGDYKVAIKVKVTNGVTKRAPNVSASDYMSAIKNDSALYTKASGLTIIEVSDKDLLHSEVTHSELYSYIKQNEEEYVRGLDDNGKLVYEIYKGIIDPIRNKMIKSSENCYIEVLDGEVWSKDIYEEGDHRLCIDSVYIYVITTNDIYVTAETIAGTKSIKQIFVKDILDEYNATHKETLTGTVQYIMKTDNNGIYSGKTENEAFAKVRPGETVIKEGLSIRVDSSLSDAADAIAEIKLLFQGDVAAENKNNHVLEYEATTSGFWMYALSAKGKRGTELHIPIYITKIGQKKEKVETSFPMPSISPTPVEAEMGDLLKDTSINYQTPESPGAPSSPEDAEDVGSVGTVTVSFSVPGISLDSITDSVSKIGTIQLGAIDKINWNKNQRTDWDIGKENRVVLRYKDVQSTNARDLPLYQDSQIRSPLDTDDTIYTNGNNKSYVVKYDTQDRTRSGNGYNTLEKYVDTYTGSVNKTMASTSVIDIPYEGDKAISIRCEYNNGTVRARLEPVDLIIGSTIKEVGVRVEYTLNGITTGLVHKWNYVEGKNGVFEWTFANVPKNSVSYSAYYITRDNEEFRSL